MKRDLYDAIIVGSGFGGSFAAYSIAKAGFRTLLLERGDWPKRDEGDWNPQQIFSIGRYRSTSPIYVKQNFNKRNKKIYPNEVVGGMSVFYAGVTLRMREIDFEKWPINYGDLEPYYSQVEELLEVSGEPQKDPYAPYGAWDFVLEGVELSTPSKRIFNASANLGYKPFKLPIAINFKNEARTICRRCNTCDGYPCKLGAKNDLTTTVLKSAQDFGLEIMSGVIVKRINEKNNEIKSVDFLDKITQKEYSPSSRIVILSGGAIQSPSILLRSNLHHYRSHHLIGKYLMRHCNTVICALFPFKTNPEKELQKHVCVSLFYEDMRKELGTSVGVIQDIFTPQPEAIKYMLPHAVSKVATKISDYIQNLICIAEDTAHFHNCVALSGDLDSYGIPITRIQHNFSREDYVRRNYLAKKAKGILREAGGLLFYTQPLTTFSHALGTVRFGNNPDNSVLDKYCRFFGIKNLFVLDGSFMPTSSGVNPSQTIGANSLRVADHIIQDHLN
jgi:choline dehydrogenase-like flavoprotein